MITRFNYEPPKKRDSSKDDIYITYSYEKRMKVLSTNKDGSVDKYVEENFWKEEKNSWSEYIGSFDIGSPSQQVMDHLTKGTPLVTAHTLPAGDYTKIQEGASIKRELESRGISIDMIIDAVTKQLQSDPVVQDPTGGK